MAAHVTAPWPLLLLPFKVHQASTCTKRCGTDRLCLMVRAQMMFVRHPEQINESHCFSSLL